MSAEAIQAHLLCLGLIVLLSLALWNGRAKPDYAGALALVVVIYPVLLFLLWFQQRSQRRAAIQYVIDYQTAPEDLRRKRQRWRLGSFVFLLILAGLLVHFGNKGLKIDFLPAQYLGYFVFIMCLLGAAGINIWYGGPLDPRFDPPLSNGDDEERSH